MSTKKDKKNGVEMNIHDAMMKPQHLLLSRDIGEVFDRFETALLPLDDRERVQARSEAFIVAIITLGRLGGMNTCIDPESSTVGKLLIDAWIEGDEKVRAQHADTEVMQKEVEGLIKSIFKNDREARDPQDLN